MSVPFPPSDEDKNAETRESAVEEEVVDPELLEQPSEQVEVVTEQSQLPPEAQGEANGGPLGCCLGMMVGLVLSLSIGVLGRIYGDQLVPVFHDNLSLILRVVMGILAIVGAIVFGYLGWRVGKRFYREYEPPPVKQRKRRVKRQGVQRS